MQLWNPLRVRYEKLLDCWFYDVMSLYPTYESIDNLLEDLELSMYGKCKGIAGIGSQSIALHIGTDKLDYCFKIHEIDHELLFLKHRRVLPIIERNGTVVKHIIYNKFKSHLLPYAYPCSMNICSGDCERCHFMNDLLDDLEEDGIQWVDSICENVGWYNDRLVILDHDNCHFVYND